MNSDKIRQLSIFSLGQQGVTRNTIIYKFCTKKLLLIRL